MVVVVFFNLAHLRDHISEIAHIFSAFLDVIYNVIRQPGLIIGNRLDQAIGNLPNAAHCIQRNTLGSIHYVFADIGCFGGEASDKIKHTSLFQSTRTRRAI